MKVEDLLVKTLETAENNTIRCKELEPLLDLIKQTDCFSEATSLEIMEYPVMDIGRKTYVAPTYKVTKNTKFKGRCILYSIGLTPQMYDPNVIHKPVRDGAVITPVQYDLETFEPTKQILLQFSVDRMQDAVIDNNESIIRQELHDLLDKVLDNPDEYQSLGTRNILVRGIFGVIENENDRTELDLSGELQEASHHLAFYLEQEEKDGEVLLHMRQKLVPLRLKDKFIEHFGDRLIKLKVTEKEIDDFLTENS